MAQMPKDVSITIGGGVKSVNDALRRAASEIQMAAINDALKANAEEIAKAIAKDLTIGDFVSRGRGSASGGGRVTHAMAMGAGGVGGAGITRGTADTVTLTRAQYEKLTTEYALSLQRLRWLLPQLSREQLRDLKLISDAEVTDDASVSFETIIAAMDAQIRIFTAAHARLTGVKPQVHQPGVMSLADNEIGIVLEMKSRGFSSQEIKAELLKTRGQKP